MVISRKQEAGSHILIFQPDRVQSKSQVPESELLKIELIKIYQYIGIILIPLF